MTQPQPAPQPLLLGEADARPALVLAPGAGAPCTSPWMEAFTRLLGERGLTVFRFDFPYMLRAQREHRRLPPDRPAVLRDAWLRVIERLGGAGGLVIGGKSMGGRIASAIADEVGALGLLCLGYPFHPPGRPERLRTAHLRDLRTPALILQGERDPFGRPEELASWQLAPTVRVRWIPDGDHSFKPRVRSGHTLASNLRWAADTAAEFVASLA